MTRASNECVRMFLIAGAEQLHQIMRVACSWTPPRPTWLKPFSGSPIDIDLNTMSVETAPDRRAEIPDESRPETHHVVCEGTGVLADAVAWSCNAGQLCIFDAEGSFVIPRRSPEGLEILQAAQRCVDRVKLERRHQQRWGAYTGNPPEQYGTTYAVSDGWRLL